MNGDKRQLKASAVAEIAKIEEQLREWDPLGVSPGEVAPSDEYDSYAPAIASLIRRGGSVDAVAEHLNGLRLAEPPDAGTRSIAERMIDCLRDS